MTDEINTSDPDGIWVGVELCAQHDHSVEQCDQCANEVAYRTKRIEELGAAVTIRLEGLARAGAPQMPPHVMSDVRLETLIDSLMGDPKDRLRFEGEVGRRLIEVLKNVQQQMRTESLIVPDAGNVRNLRG